MGLHLVTGKANAGKSGVVTSRLFESLKRGEMPTLVVPTIADARRATSEIAEKTPVGVAVASWDQWVRSLWALHGDGRRIVSEAARAAFVERALEAAGPGPVAASAGLRILLGRAVSEMTLDPDAIPAPTAGLRHLLAICGHYDRIVREAGLIERAAALSELAVAPPRIPGTVAFNRFIDFSKSQLALIEALSAGHEVVVTLTWEEHFEPTAAVNGTVEQLRSFASSVQHEPEFGVNAEVGRLANALYSTRRISGDGEVIMATADGEEAEASLVARYAVEALAQGTPPDRLVIAYPRLGTQQALLAGALRAEGIDFEEDVARPLGTSPLGRTVLALIDLSLGFGGRTTANSLLLAPHSDVERQTAAEMDAAWRQNRKDDGRLLLSDLERLRGTRLAAAAGSVRQLAEGRTPENGRMWQSLLDSLISVPISRALGERSVPDAALAEALRTDAMVTRSLATLVGEMLSVEGKPLTMSDVRSALHEVTVGGTRGEREGAVQVTELARLGSRRFDVVIIAGMTADEAPVGSPSGLLDEVRELLTGDVGVPVEQAARLAFYYALSRARNKLVLIRREADGQGRALRPSVFWDEVLDAYRQPTEERDAWPSAGPQLERLGAVRIAESAPVFSRGRRALRMAAASVRSESPTRKGQLVNPEAIAALGSLEVFSATEIEAYLACPYRWFYERVVRPEELDREVDARAIGTHAHALLTRFYDALADRLGERRVTPGNVKQCRELLATICDEAAPYTGALGLSEELSLVRARRWVEAAIEEDALLLPAFEPVEHEFAFPVEGDAQIILGGVRFTGRIDRIDRAPHAVFVTDYKTSRKVSGQGEFADQGKVQAVVYALAAEQAFGLPCAGSVYRSLRTRELRGYWRADLIGGALTHGNEEDSLGEAGVAQLVEETGERVAAAVAGIRAGRIAREPARRSDCAFCSIRSMCDGGGR